MPVFDINMRDVFPMPTLEQGSPFGGLLSNAIAKRLAMAKMESAENEAPYAGLAKLSDIRSKNAYANIVGGQALAKVMEHPELLASIKDPQKKLDFLTYLFTTQGNSNNDPINAHINRALLKISQGNQSGGILGTIGKGIYNLFQGNTPSNNIYAQPSQQPVSQAQGNGGNQDYGANNQAAPQEVSNVANGLNLDGSPRTQGVPETKVSPPPTQSTPRPRTEENIQFGENAASYKRQTAQEEAGGKERGQQIEKQIAEAETKYKALSKQSKEVDYLTNLVSDKKYNRLIDTPFINSKAQTFYRNTATQAEKEYLGKVQAATDNYVTSSIGLFPQRFTDTDMKFVQSMKSDKNDTIGVRLGKLRALKFFIELDKQREEKIYDYMRKDKLDMIDAVRRVDKELNTNAIEKSISDNVQRIKDAEEVTVLDEHGNGKKMTRGEANRLMEQS